MRELQGNVRCMASPSYVRSRGWGSGAGDTSRGTPDHAYLAAVANTTSGIVHLTADFIGTTPLLLTDQALISGVLVSAAGAAGMKASGTPMVIAHPDGGLSVILPLDGCHMSVHTMPARELAILDVIAAAPHDPQRAFEVIARRLTARSVRVDQRVRGP
jgi:S-adenosylmethionine/arginine decarboxylase-like enzyme